VAAGDSVKLDGSGSWSAGGRALQHSWAMLTRPLNSKAVLSSATGATPSFVPDVPGAYVVQLMVIDEGGLKSAPVTTLITASALSITTFSLPDAQLGNPYSFVLTADGGTPPYTWKSAGGRLPAGFSLDPTTGTLSGAALTMNAAFLTFMVTDSGTPPQSATAQMSLTIVASGLQITTTSLPTATKGAPYSQTLSATGGIPPYTWSIAAGSLPSGWTLAPTTGLISGIANDTVNNSQVVVRVTDSAATPGSVTWTYIINVVANPLAITTASLPNGQTGVPYSATLTASNAVGALTWQISSGTLPAGLTLNTATGEISGTPQGVVNATPLTVRVSDSGTLQTTTANLTLTITGPSISVTTTSLPNATAGVPYSQALQAAGGTGALTWKLTGGALPAGITLGTDGTISGTTAVAGPATFSVSVTDSSSPAQTAQATLTLTVTVAALTITTTSLPNAMVGVPYSAALTATGGTPPYSWSIVSGRLPGGFTFDATGVIGGAPQFTDPANITFRVTDSSSPAKTTNASFNLDILPVSFAILTNSLPDGQAGAPYSMQIQSAGGVAPYSWSVTAGSLPAGVSLNPSTGLLSGTPTATGSSSMTIRVSDSSLPKLVATAGLTMTISGKTMTITTPALANGAVGVAYSQQLTATGGTGGLTWQVTTGTLPAGLTLNALTGLISGTPTAAAAGVPLTFKVSDSSSPALSATANFTMTITGGSGGPTITTASLGNGTVGVAYSQTLAATGGSLPYSWQLTSGALPAGLTFSPAGVLSGTPSVAVNATPLTFKVTDASSQSASVTLTLTISTGTGGGTLTVLTTSLPPALVGVPYAQQLVATGGTPPYTWNLPVGRLPGGFTLSPDGVISGTANPANQPDGFLDPLLLGFQVTDSSTPKQSTIAQLVFNISKQALQITTTSLPGGSVGVPYSFTMQASGGGSGVYTWAVTSGVLPSGLSLDPATGVISGTPGATMVRRVIISVTDPAPPPVVFGGSQTTVSASFTLQIQ
jgi:hypothetical protein